MAHQTLPLGTKVPEGEYYRVRVGPFTTEEEAKQVAKVLKREGHRIFLDEIRSMLSHQRPPIPDQNSPAKQQAKQQ